MCSCQKNPKLLEAKFSDIEEKPFEGNKTLLICVLLKWPPDVEQFNYPLL